MTLEIIAAVALVAANGFFVAAEFGIARMRPTQVDELERARKAGAKSVRHAVDRLDAYLAACQLGITLASIGLGVVGKPAFEKLLRPLLGEAAEVAGVGLAGALAFGIITLLHVVVGELSPKSLAISRTNPTLLLVAPPMRAFYLATKPLVDFFNGLGNLLLKPFGVPPASESGSQPHSEGELRSLLRESGREGLIDPQERSFADHALTFGDRRAREVMIPRARISFLTTADDLESAVDSMLDAGRTRMPLCRPGGLDEPLGIVHVKDLLRAVAREEPRDISRLARPLARVADGTLLDEVLRDMRRTRRHLALVADEHGTTVGLLTLEDLIEEIVGEIEDEFDPDVESLFREQEGELIVQGTAPVHDVAERLGAPFEDAHESTIGGHLIERLGRRPDSGETVELNGRPVRIVETDEAQIHALAFRLSDAREAGGD